MEHISTIQLIIPLIIVAALILQYFAIKRGMFVPVIYSKNQRIGAAIIVAAPMIVFGIIVNSHHTPIFVIFGIVMGYACFRRKTWYRRK